MGQPLTRASEQGTKHSGIKGLALKGSSEAPGEEGKGVIKCFKTCP